VEFAALQALLAKANNKIQNLEDKLQKMESSSGRSTRLSVEMKRGPATKQYNMIEDLVKKVEALETELQQTRAGESID
jgi:Skp family chaperone for outer membrane proteins